MATIYFKGKEIVRNYHLSVPYHELRPDAKKGLSRKPSLNDNLIIHGDNLLALKALLPTYAGKVKCIYIDPPYNTGNEKWAYNDKVNSPMMKEWLGKVVDRDDLTRHDKWLCMMMPRLKLLRELLADDGVIFVSIDDNEVANMRLLMDEIFGEENFVADIIWEKSDSPKMDVKLFSPNHDFIVVCSKSNEFFELEKDEFSEIPSHYNKTDEEGRIYYLKPLRVMGGNISESLYFPMIAPDGTEVFPLEPNGEKGCWRWSKEKVKNEPNRIEWISGKKGWVPYFRIYADTRKELQPFTIWRHEEVGSNRTSKNEIRNLFDSNVFETPKPTQLIKKILKLSTDKNSIILDSFAGSGTTAHAVLALNKEDGGNRKFILVEMEDYSDKITAERVRRVIKGYGKTEGAGGQFSYFELGKPIDAERILKGEDLPSFIEMARYIFYTATGEEFNEKKIDEKTGFIGEGDEYKVYLLYKPNLEYLKSTALTLEFAKKLGKSAKRRLVFAPTKYLDQEHLERFNIEFAQLPFEIYNRVK